jgi:hypothetical protein
LDQNQNVDEVHDVDVAIGEVCDFAVLDAGE